MEKHIEAYLVKAVKNLGGKAYKFNSVSHRGVADRIICLPNGEAWFVEVKQPNGKLSELQKLSADDMAWLNQKYACLWAKEDVDAWVATVSRTGR